MAKTSKAEPQSTESKATPQIEYVNLQDFGYEKAGNVKGDPDIYASYLEQILNGDLVEVNHREISEEDKKIKRGKLKDLEGQLDEIKKNNASIEKEIKEKETKIETRRDELLNIHERHNTDDEARKTELFSPMKYIISLVILIMLSGYLFFFYVSAAYKALYTDFEKIAANIADGIGTGSIMPSPGELAEAMRFNPLLFLVPFVFFAFGWVFHVLLELKHKAKFVFLGLLIALTFVVDFLLAIIIHNNTEQAKELMGLDTIEWSVSSTFYIILFLGFLVYIIWSIILDFSLREWAKRGLTLNIKKIMKHLKGDLKLLQAKIVPDEPIRIEIAFIREDLNTLTVGNVKSYIDQFTTGWLSYLSPQNLKELKVKCQNLKRDFEERHKIKSGVVKVVKKRSL